MRVLGWLGGLTVAGYVAAALAAFGFVRYVRHVDAVAFTDILLPSRWDHYRVARGDQQIAAAKRLVEERKFTEGFLHARAGVAAAPGHRDGRLLLADLLVAARQPEEEAMFRELNRVAWEIIQEAFSNKVITPGVTKADDVVWWMRQRISDLGLSTWFQPSVEIQRQFGSPELVGVNPTILRGDMLHCDFGITALGLNTDTQHNGYVLRDGETDVPAGLKNALRASNRLQDITVEELRPGRTGNEVLAATLKRMRDEKIDGTEYSHPIGLHGHGAGALIGLWDYQDGVPGRGDHKVIPGMWYSIELQATTPVPEWGNQQVRSAQEEDVIIDANGKVRWAFGRQSTFHIVK